MPAAEALFLPLICVVLLFNAYDDTNAMVRKGLHLWSLTCEVLGIWWNYFSWLSSNRE